MKAKQILVKVLRLVNRLVWFPFLCVGPGRRGRRKNSAGGS